MLSLTDSCALTTASSLHVIVGVSVVVSVGVHTVPGSAAGRRERPVRRERIVLGIGRRAGQADRRALGRRCTARPRSRSARRSRRPPLLRTAVPPSSSRKRDGDRVVAGRARRCASRRAFPIRCVSVIVAGARRGVAPVDRRGVRVVRTDVGEGRVHGRRRTGSRPTKHTSGASAGATLAIVTTALETTAALYGSLTLRLAVTTALSLQVMVGVSVLVLVGVHTVPGEAEVTANDQFVVMKSDSGSVAVPLSVTEPPSTPAYGPPAFATGAWSCLVRMRTSSMSPPVVDDAVNGDGARGSAA